MQQRTREERFWSKVDRTTNPDGCWPWTAAIDQSVGYGRFSWATDKLMWAHRASYTLTYGEIGPGLEIDHSCRTRACVRPDHLRAATHKQNQENRGQRQSNNTSGYRGVFRSGNRWAARVKHKGRTYIAGNYVDILQAAKAAAALRAELFTHTMN